MLGLDFGASKINEVLEPVRKEILETLEISGLDGPASE